MAVPAGQPLPVKIEVHAGDIRGSLSGSMVVVDELLLPNNSSSGNACGAFLRGRSTRLHCEEVW